ncbi:hypothetical protein [Neoroseomonas lacus]|uniref:Uncharacterized protein n=1 Tax=Neoroseomonas lacus TaxID=287609 RepID=A0A917KY58_9PROT|nr:hypothetical protein [Neoroseomonas lacus]GGJ35410.1 hypothetical protein GCM10011320_48960 [Neoroseomonas lacus]
MNPREFSRLLDTHGADPDRWPEALREAARALCEISPTARGQWMAAKRLDVLLAAGRAPVPDPARRARIVAGAMARLRVRAEPFLDWRWLFTRPIGAAFAASLVAGWLVGMELGDGTAPHQMPADLRLEDLLQ